MHHERGGLRSIKRCILTILSLFLILQPLAAQPLNRLTGRALLYEVKEGESFYSIARSHGLGSWHLRRANPGMYECRPGVRLLLPLQRIVPKYQGSGVVVNLPERMLYVFTNGSLETFYPIAIGRPELRWQTPVGNYHVAFKAINPTWYPPRWAGLEKPVPPGQNNPLGDRWIGLSKSGYGFHGTPSLYSIGLSASHGCMRMYPEHVQSLYRSLKRGSRVEVIYRPVLLSLDKEAGECRLSVFPDVYGRTGSLYACAVKLLEEAGLARATDKSLLAGIIKRAAGLSEPLLSTTKIYFCGRQLPAKHMVIHEEGEIYLEKGDLALCRAFVGFPDSYAPTGITGSSRSLQALSYLENPATLIFSKTGKAYRQILGGDYLPFLPFAKSIGLICIMEGNRLFLVTVRPEAGN